MLHIFKQSVTKSGLLLYRQVSSGKSGGATFTFFFFEVKESFNLLEYIQ